MHTKIFVFHPKVGRDYVSFLITNITWSLIFSPFERFFNILNEVEKLLDLQAHVWNLVINDLMEIKTTGNNSFIAPLCMR